MQILTIVRMVIEHRHFRLLALCLAAALLAGMAWLLLPAGPALAAGTCTSTADGSWGSASTWDCGYVPSSADDVVIGENDVTLDANQSANNLTITFYGVLRSTVPMSLTIYGDFDVEGIFDDHEDGTVVLAGASQTITTAGYWVDFSNLTKIASGPGSSLAVDPAVGGVGGIHILDALTLQGASSDYLALRSTVPGSQWQILAEDEYNIDRVDVQDSKNVAGYTIDVTHGHDSGNNTGWFFAFSAESSVALTSSANPSFEDRPVTFTASISPIAATGTVTFTDGTDAITGCESVPVTNGLATCTTDDLDLGSHDITAVFSGDETYSGSTSAVLVQQVVEVETTIYLPIIVKP